MHLILLCEFCILQIFYYICIQLFYAQYIWAHYEYIFANTLLPDIRLLGSKGHPSNPSNKVDKATSFWIYVS